MKFGVKTDKGMVREINEDSYRVSCGSPGLPDIFLVADGMGGHNSGEIASKMAADFIDSYIRQHPQDFLEEKQVRYSLQSVIEQANNEIFSKSKERKDTYGMGTTLTVCVMHPHKLFIGHIGDSRLYLIRDGGIGQITTDHSYIEELIKNGSITRKEAAGHPKRNIITRALGCSDSVMVDIYTCELANGDFILLCTDGLTNRLEEEEIKNIILENEDPQAACECLVQQANEKGGDDNITVIVVRNE